MALFYAASTNGFYDDEIHIIKETDEETGVETIIENMIPVDAVEITQVQHQALIDGQSERGKEISADGGGFPILIDTVYSDDVKEQMFIAFVNGLVDDAAIGHGFLGVVDAVSYADEPAYPAKQDLGLAFRAWRSNVWLTFDGIISDWQAGTIPEPTEASILAAIPAFVPPP